MKIFKCTTVFLLLLAFFFPTEKTQASHLIGGEITYEYIGTTAHPHRYKVSLVLHRTTRYSNVQGPSSAIVCITSSCFPNQNVNLSVKPGTPPTGQAVPNLTECILASNSNFTPVFEHFFEGTMDLPGVCSDFVFSHTFVCCRIGIQGIVNYSGFGTGGSRNYIEATLNNTQGNNTSPSFITPPARTFCLNNFFSWNQGTIEPDNDSIQYDLGTAMNALADCSPGDEMVFDPSFSRLHPLATAPGTSFNLRQNGVIEFTTGTLAGNYIVVIVVREYRLHQASGFYIEIGSVMREMLINLVDNCNPIVQNGPRFDFNHPNVSNGPISTSALGVVKGNYPHPNIDSVPNASSPTGYTMNLPIIQYPCYDSIISLHFADYVQCPSITPSGSEFRLIDPDSNLLPITHVTKNCNASLETRHVDLHLLNPIPLEGDYYMYIKEGLDSNTILNACGFAMPEFFLFVIRVSNCTEPQYDITNVSVLNNDHIQIFWEADTSTFPLFAVSAWNFLRSSDNGSTFNRVGRLRGANVGFQTNWIDYRVNNDNVNSRSYRYQMELEISGVTFPFTRDVTSIYLERGFGYGSGLSWNIVWNDYDGWPNPEYTLMIWDIDSTGTWNMVSQPGNPTQDDNMLFDYQTVTNRKGESFALRIDASNPNSTGTNYIASSNYLYLDVPRNVSNPNIPPSSNLVIPNVFTPNGDGKNDVFSIGGIENYLTAQVVFSNRWGKIVYQNNSFHIDNAWDGRDMQTGQIVPSGIYYYVINLRGNLRGLPDLEETGTVQVFSGSR